MNHRRVCEWINASSLSLDVTFTGHRVCLRDGAIAIEVGTEAAAFEAIRNWRGSRLGEVAL